MPIHKDNFSYSVLLSIDNTKSRGSGFRLKYNGYNFLVSAKHVFYDGDNKLHGDTLIINCPSSPLGNGIVMFEVDLKKAKIFTSLNSDVCIIFLAKYNNLSKITQHLKYEKEEHKRPTTLELDSAVIIIQETTKHITSVDIEATRRLNEIGIANEVYLMGYPTSLGLTNSKYFDITKPLIRKGIVSGINLNEETFIIDCPSYQGKFWRTYR